MSDIYKIQKEQAIKYINFMSQGKVEYRLSDNENNKEKLYDLLTNKRKNPFPEIQSSETDRLSFSLKDGRKYIGQNDFLTLLDNLPSVDLKQILTFPDYINWSINPKAGLSRSGCGVRTVHHIILDLMNPYKFNTFDGHLTVRSVYKKLIEAALGVDNPADVKIEYFDSEQLKAYLKDSNSMEVKI